MRAIAAKLNLPKTTVIERLSGRTKGEGHIAGGKGKPESSRTVSKRVSKQVKITITVTTLTELSTGSANGSFLWWHVLVAQLVVSLCI